MNSVQLTGRLTRDPEVNYSNGGTTVARFTLAVNRRFTQENGPTADFIRCVAFGKTAEFIEKYFRKGRKMDLNGRIQTGSYENQEEQKVYTTDIVVENAEFGESKTSTDNRGSNATQNHTPQYHEDGFMDIPDGIDEELPFS